MSYVFWPVFPIFRIQSGWCVYYSSKVCNACFQIYLVLQGIGFPNVLNIDLRKLVVETQKVLPRNRIPLSRYLSFLLGVSLTWNKWSIHYISPHTSPPTPFQYGSWWTKWHLTGKIHLHRVVLNIERQQYLKLIILVVILENVSLIHFKPSSPSKCMDQGFLPVFCC